MDDRGFVFTSDLLLAMIIVTMAIGLTTSTFESLNHQMQDFSSRQSLERTVNDAADYLVKSPGNPTNWERHGPSTSLPGLAAIDRGLPDSNFLHNRKVDRLNKNPSLIHNLVHTTNYRMVITTVDTHRRLIEVNSPNPTVALNNAKEVAVANRTAVFMPGEVLFQMIDLAHINPAHPGHTTFLWFLRGGDGIYVGPGNVTTAINPDSSFFVTAADIAIYDFFIIINDNTGVRSARYGVTDGDAVVNGTYEGLDDTDRRDAVRDELRRVHGGGGWQDMRPLTTGSVIQIDNDLQRVLDRGGGPDMKMWVDVASDPKDNFDISVVQVFQGQRMQRIPVKLVLKIWE